MSVGHPDARDPLKKRVIVAAWQTGARSNGGLESLSLLLESSGLDLRLVVTNRWTPFAERWARLGPVVVRKMVAGAERRRPRLLSIVAELVVLARNNAWFAQQVAGSERVVLHCNDEVALLNFGIGARLSGCPVVFHVRDTRSSRNLYRVLRWRSFLALSSVFVTLSQEMRAWWVEYLTIRGWRPIRASKLRHLYSVVSAPSKHEPAAGRSPCPSGRFVVGVVGAFSPKKGQLEFIERCCHPLAADGFHFLFFGDTDTNREYFLACRDAAAHLVGSHIHFLGHVEHMTEYYSVLDVLVIVSRHEGLARSMIEALAAGVPVVSFAVCSAREILVDHGAGIVIPLGDHTALIRELRNVARDRSRISFLSARAREVAKTLFTPDAVARAYRDLLGELCDAGSSGQ